MKREIQYLLLALCLLSFAEGVASPRSSRKQERARREVLSRSRGFHKDIFMDGGIALSSRHSLPAAQFLGITMEYFASAPKKSLSQRDTLLQRNIFCGDKNDSNGWLLYPDGEPRFRLLYVNGGSAGKHAISMGEEGRARIREFVESGGSYVGTCAGAYIATNGGISRHGEIRNSDVYWQLWPGYANSSQLYKKSTTLLLERKSPLLRYFDFGGDRAVAEVRHNGGCYAHHGIFGKIPEGTEPLARYSFDNDDIVRIDGELAIWSYKQNEECGRVILCGSHPEGVGSGERVELMAAMLLYAMDGNPAPKIKGSLNEGEVREMNKRTEQRDPAYTRIGDGQYHHFAIDVPRKCKRVVINLDGYEGERNFSLSLCAKQGEPAYHDNTTLKSVARGVKKQLVIEEPKAGEWFVSVFCENRVVAQTNKYGTYYRGRISVLNGVPYKISVEYE